MVNISTHTPHARRDKLLGNNKIKNKISTHTPHARRDKLYYRLVNALLLFQLTRLMRGVTTDYYTNIIPLVNFNSHASCEAWHSYIRYNTNLLNFNSHASCEAWLKIAREQQNKKQNFNSHASCEAWHSVGVVNTDNQWISTHTPHARRDLL